MTEDDEPVLELHIQAEVKVCRVLPLQRQECHASAWNSGGTAVSIALKQFVSGRFFCAPAILVTFVQKEGEGENQDATLGHS